MAMNQTVLPIPPESVLVIGTGGESRERQEWAGGVSTGQPLIHSNGGTIRTLSGVSVSVGGRGFDGADVTTTTALESIAGGVIYRASGEVTVTHRADAKMVGRGTDARPRGELKFAVFIETLEPVGDVNSLLKGSSRSKADA